MRTENERERDFIAGQFAWWAIYESRTGDNCEYKDTSSAHAQHNRRVEELLTSNKPELELEV